MIRSSGERALHQLLLDDVLPHDAPSREGAQVLLSLHSLAHLPPSVQLACLSIDELARAKRFVFERDRRRYLAARCALRHRLGQHIGVMAQALRIADGPFGKPHLVGAPGRYFNLSHSDDVALIGISDDGEVGVDVEVLRQISDAESLAKSHFAPAEFAEYMGSDDASKDAAFLRIWTRKEACLKAIGTGLSVAPHAFDAGPGLGLTRLCIETPRGRANVVVRSLALDASTLGAVAWALDSGGLTSA